MVDQNDKTQIGIINEQIKEIFKDIEDGVKNFVTKIEFNSRVMPLERIVYGMVGMVLIAFMTALIAFIIKQ